MRIGLNIKLTFPDAKAYRSGRISIPFETQKHTIPDACQLQNRLVKRLLMMLRSSELIVLLVLCMGKYVESASPSYNNPVNQSTNQQQKITDGKSFYRQTKGSISLSWGCSTWYGCFNIGSFYLCGYCCFWFTKGTAILLAASRFRAGSCSNRSIFF